MRTGQQAIPWTTLGEAPPNGASGLGLARFEPATSCPHSPTIDESSGGSARQDRHRQTAHSVGTASPTGASGVARTRAEAALAHPDGPKSTMMESWVRVLRRASPGITTWRSVSVHRYSWLHGLVRGPATGGGHQRRVRDGDVDVLTRGDRSDRFSLLVGPATPDRNPLAVPERAHFPPWSASPSQWPVSATWVT